MYLVDTQFIFGLRKSDQHHQKCSYILKKHPDKICFSSISILEVTIVMMTQNKNHLAIAEFISTVQDLFKLHNVPEIKFKSQSIIESLSLRTKNPKLSFFDSILLAVSDINSFILLGDDNIFPKFSQIESISLDKFIDKFKE